MKKLPAAIDSVGILRFFHLHCFVHIYRMFFATDASICFTTPRFELFKPIKNLYRKNQTSHSLLKNILFSYQNQIIVGSLITLIFASCNLLVPQLIKSFLHFMHEHHVNKSQLASAQGFIQKFLTIQFLRIIFGQHAKRLFHQLAIQIQSSLCKKLIRKSLSFDRQFRDRIPKSQMMQLQNVDLKLIFLMFKNMYMMVQAPFTILVAIVLLFRQSHIYGFIGIYWFVIAFLLQRQLDGKMRHCNQTKLRLIDERSKVNYQLFGKIKEAKVIHSEEIIIQKNNDLFIEQNHDHYLFYNYSTLYDITLLILPIIVVVTISLFDLDNVDHITVEQVYVMLQLLGICYNPMKQARMIAINLHDGLHSLKKLEDFFNLPDQIASTLINQNIGEGEVLIMKNTICTHPNPSCDFYLHINQHVQLKKGSRLIVLGKKGQGKTSFIRMLLGHMKKIEGVIFLNGKRGSSLEKHYFRKASILQNIVFSEENEDNRQQHREKVRLAQILYKEFGLEPDFIKKKGINTIIDQKCLTKKQKKKISLARVFTANPDIYFLESPFNFLEKNVAFAVQKRLIQKQKQNKTVIMTQTSLQYAQQSDHVMILQNGSSIQYGTFSRLVNDHNSHISYFFKQKRDKQTVKQPDSGRKIIGKFKNRVTTALTYIQQDDDSNDQDTKSSAYKQILTPKSYLKYGSRSLTSKKNKISKQMKVKSDNFWSYFSYYMRSISFMELAFALLIIGVAQFLHIFIHFYIGHLDEDQHGNPYLQFQNILFLQFILTVTLAGIIYFQGQVSSLIAIIQGNNLYRESFKSVVRKPINWFNGQFSLKLADKFNHDYEQIFIACHNLLGIYKNVIILVITIFVVSADKMTAFITIFFVSLVYFTIGAILRKVEHKVVSHYYDYKYQFVKIFEECLDGGQTIQIFDAQKDTFTRTQKVYTKLASYKLAQSHTAYGEQLFCDFTSLILLVIAFQYGLLMKVEGDNYNIALIGTTIHLLLNVSQVLKNIVKLTINFETFFNINISPFLETLCQGQDQQSNTEDLAETTEKNMQGQQRQLNAHKTKKSDLRYQIKFQDVSLLDQDDNTILPKHDKLNLTIRQQSTVSIYEENERARAKLVQALTKNYTNLLGRDSEKYGTVTIGGINIRQIPDQTMSDYVGVIMSNNFFFTGTLRENITWKRNSLTPQEEMQVIQTARELTLDTDLKDFDELLLDCPIQFIQEQINSQISKKIAILRMSVRKPKIVILKNTSSYIGNLSLVKMIKSSCFCTIIKITGNSQQIPGLARVIYMDNLRVLQDGKIQRFQDDFDTKIGKLLAQNNMQGYEYQNKVVFSPRKFKSRKKKNHHLDSEMSALSQYSPL